MSFAYQWLRDMIPIGGATTQNYKVVSDDLGHTLYLQVTATNAAGSVIALSAGLAVPNTTATAPVNISDPFITGSTVGLQSVSTTGTWTGTATITYTYQWYLNGFSVPGETSNAYTPQNGDVGKSLYCVVTGSNAVGSSSAQSNSLTVVGTSPLNPAPQYPNMLDRYVVRSPNPVAGVDYGVGYASTVILQDPATWIPPAGVDIDFDNLLIRVSGDDVLIDSLDLELSGGWTILYTGNGMIVQNCHFKSVHQNTFIQGAIGSDGAIIRNCIVDGNGDDSFFGALVFGQGSGTWTIRRTWFKDPWSDATTWGSNAPNVLVIDIQECLVQNTGSSGISSGAHPDVFQIFNTATYTLTWANNTWYQPDGAILSQGIFMSDSFGPPTCLNATLTGNTMVCSGTPVPPGGVNWCFGIDISELVGTATVSGNYVDPTALIVGFVSVRSDGGGGHSGTVINTGNINMLTGGAIS